MIKKNITLINGIVGIIGGLILTFSTKLAEIVVQNEINSNIEGAVDSITSDPLGSISNVASGNVSYNTTQTTFLATLILGIGIALIILGAMGYFFRQKEANYTVAASLLFVLGGIITLFSEFTWLAGILALVAGVLYLMSVKQTAQ